MSEMRTRQIHLDFHTSEHIPDVGSKFDKEEFQKALIVGNVNSITIFGKCHHGYHYFPTQVGTLHPTMNQEQDLAGDMMKACHEIDVKAPLYLTLGWSVLDAQQHPEWVCRTRTGGFHGENYDVDAKESDVKPECSWLYMCSAGGYRNYLYEMAREACLRYERLDGLFFDIVYMDEVCYCDHCKAGMEAGGYNQDVLADAKAYYEQEKHVTIQGLRSILEQYHPEATIFFNSGGAELHKPQWHYANTHFELEDLPTTWGGYDKMPIRAKYFAKTGRNYLGMTGKFHRSWGEFGGYKTPEALKYECAALMASGASISVGDQMHPLGKLDKDTYEIIGHAFSYVKQIEEYCIGVEETSKIGVFINEDIYMNEAIATLLLDCHIDFDVVYDAKDLMRFDLIIMPDGYSVEEGFEEVLNQYLAQGKKLVMLGGSGLNEEKSRFGFDCSFVYKGKSDMDNDYFEVTPMIGENIVQAPVLCYESAHVVEGEGEVLAYVREPYFKRTYGGFCSHYNTPYVEERASYPAVIRNENVIYIAHPIATMYKGYGATYHRRYFKNILDSVYGDYNVTANNFPTQGRVHFVEQNKENRYVLHLLYASPIQRGSVAVIEDIPVIQNIQVEMRVDKSIKSAKLMPQNIEVEYIQKGNHVSVLVDEMCGHQIVVLEY